MGKFKKGLIFVLFEIVEIVLFLFIFITGVFGIFGNNTQAWILFLYGIGAFVLFSIFKMFYCGKEDN